MHGTYLFQQPSLLDDVRDRLHLHTFRFVDVLEGEQLLGTEGLVVDLRSGLDEVLQVGAGEEVAEVDEFAVGLVLDCGC